VLLAVGSVLYWTRALYPGLIRPRTQFIQFPEEDALSGRRVLVVDDVWTKGRNSVTVANRIDAAGGKPEICVLHYKPSYSLYPGHAPTYYAAVTDAYMIYPWELDRGPEVLGAWN